jgi:hypothetical protein
MLIYITVTQLTIIKNNLYTLTTYEMVYSVTNKY